LAHNAQNARNVVLDRHIQTIGDNIWAEPSTGKGNCMDIGESAKQPANSSSPDHPSESHAPDSEDEARRIRRLQIMISMVSSVISQDPSLTVEEAAELAAGAKRAALAMFPGKELAYDLLYKPRIQRIITERFRLQ
jgi:hypothetical protein